jgi:hypothetical protein
MYREHTETSPVLKSLQRQCSQHIRLGFFCTELRDAKVFPYAFDGKKGDQVVFYRFPRDEQLQIVQSEALPMTEAEIVNIDDYGYYRKVFISPGPESGHSGSPLFRKESS